MRLLFSLLVMWGSTSFAADKLNHLSCEYSENSSGWQYEAGSYNRDSFSLAAGESKETTSAWTDDRASNLAFCNLMVGTSDESVVQIVSYIYLADRFNGMQSASCEFTGENVRLLKQQASLVHRGDFASLLVENWLPHGGNLLLKQYVPFENESEDVITYAESKCLSLLPH